MASGRRRQAEISRRRSSAVTAGWSPNITSRPSQVPGSCRTAVRRELPMPSAQSRLTKAVAGVLRSSGATSAAWAPKTTLRAPPATATACDRAVCRSGRPAKRANCLGAPNRLALPAARTTTCKDVSGSWITVKRPSGDREFRVFLPPPVRTSNIRGFFSCKQQLLHRYP